MIKLVNINKFYKNGPNSFHALKDINITFDNVGMNFILGKSGSGKSTLLNVIGGIDSYDSGELWIDDLCTKKFTSKDYNNYRNTYIGFVFQEFNVLNGLNVYDNIALSLDLHREDVKKNHDRIMKIIDDVGLAGLEHRMMNQISGGQKQRVAIARALIKNPKVIIADEPTGNLDQKNREMIMDILKKLSANHLVIVVTHEQKLAEKYGDRIIRIKDGMVIEDSANVQNVVVKQLDLKPVKTPIKTSFNLALKSIFRNEARFILMILLFAFSLTFASVVVNIYLSNSTLVYAKYQKEYNNQYVTLQYQYQTLGINNNTAFIDILIPKFFNNYENTSADDFIFIKGMDFNIDIRRNESIPIDDVYQPVIKRIHKVNNLDNIVANRDYIVGYKPTKFSQDAREGDVLFAEVAITDYVAEALLHYQYFGSSVTSFNQLKDKMIMVDNFKVGLKIVGIFRTNTHDFIDQGLKSPELKAAFLDNLSFYNGIFTTPDILEYFVSNIDYFYDDLIVNVSKRITQIPNVKFMNFDSYTMTITGEPPKVPNEGEAIQMAVSTGFLRKTLDFGPEVTPEEMLSYINYVFMGIDPKGNPKEEHVKSIFAIFGVGRSPVSTSFVVTGIVNDDNPVVYFREVNSNLVNYARASFFEGSYLTVKITDDVNYNSQFYREMLNKRYFIDNVSFKKIVLVENFINDNLYFLVGLFFVFGLFSILLIFNFVIISIKKSTRDIGIYMSLGMSGSKISLIYFFQVLVMGVVSFVLATIGTIIFILVLDGIFSTQAMVNLRILKINLLGLAIILGIATIIPNFAVLFPLFNLSRKKPVDVIKSS